MRILVPVIDSMNLLAGLRYAVRELRVGEPLEVHLLHLGSPKAGKKLAPARALLKRFHVPCTEHFAAGDRARAIIDLARRLDAERIVLGAAPQWSATRLAEDSMIEKVMSEAPVRVTLISGRSVSPVERYAVPAGVAGLAALLLAAD